MLTFIAEVAVIVHGRVIRQIEAVQHRKLRGPIGRAVHRRQSQERRTGCLPDIAFLVKQAMRETQFDGFSTAKQFSQICDFRYMPAENQPR